jgi:hypothetical protein
MAFERCLAPGQAWARCWLYQSKNENDKEKIMKNHVGNVLAIIAMLIWAGGEVAAFEIYQITDTEYDDVRPMINDNGDIVWSGGVGSSGSKGCEIFIRDRDTGSTTQITADNYWDISPEINANGKVVWFGNGGRDRGLDFEVFLYDKTSRKTVQLTADDLNDYSPKINDSGQVVWRKQLNYYHDKIYLDNGIGVGAQVIGAGPGIKYPQINASGQVTWYEGLHSYLDNIFLSNASGEFQLNTSIYSQSSPQINAHGDVVWYGYDGTGSEIYFYDASEKRTRQLTDNTFHDTQPAFNDNGQVVWRESSSDGTIDAIFLYDNDTTRQISSDGFNSNAQPLINAFGDVTWYGHDGNDSEIFFYDNITGQTTLLTDNDYDDIYPQINNRRNIVWQGSDGNDYEVFLTTVTATPEPATLFLLGLGLIGFAGVIRKGGTQ